MFTADGALLRNDILSNTLKSTFMDIGYFQSNNCQGMEVQEFTGDLDLSNGSQLSKTSSIQVEEMN